MTKYYYNQLDSRWENKMYSSTNNSSQTIGSSGCGPASGAMIVSNIKEVILPDNMADLFVSNGYRTANNGTAWSAFKWLSDKWQIGFEQTNSLDKAIDNIRNGGMSVAAVGRGLFTTNGHILVIAGINEDILTIYDPYLYSTKFNSSNRKGKATIEGTNVYCTIDNFKNYANAVQYFCYKDRENNQGDNTNSGGQETKTNTVGQIKTFNKSATIYENSNLTGTKYSYLANTTVEILENLNGIDKVKSRVTGRIGYVNNIGLYKEGNSSNDTDNTSNIKNTIGQIKTFKNNTSIYEKSDLTGVKYSYLANTTVEILENLNGIDKVKSRVTGRTGYVKNNVYR